MAGFEQVGIAWHREIGKSSVVVREGSDGRLDFALSPPIGSHSPEEHQTNAHAAAIQFKVLMTLAERANGRVIQTSLVSTCLTENASGTRLLAEYPLIPLSFANLCLGFRNVLSGGVPQLGGGEVE